MKKNLIALLFVAACVLGGYAQADKPFAPADHGFSVVFPGGDDDPEFRHINDHGDLGDFGSTYYTVFLDHAYFAVITYDYPENVFRVKSGGKILEDGLDGIRQQPGAVISNVKRITLDGYPAMSYDATLIVDGQLTYARRVDVIAKPHVYSCEVSGFTQARLDQPDVVKFARSFHLQHAYVDQPFTSKDGRFAIAFSADVPDPTFSTTTLHSEEGDAEAKQYAVEAERGNWTVQYYEYPEKLFQTKTARKLLNDMFTGLQKDPVKKLSNRRDLIVDGFPAIVFDFQMTLANTRFYGRYAIVVAKPRVYNYLFTSRDQTQLTKPDVLKFFRSFHIQK